ncbi:MAG: zinc finger domain-containing protein [Candidatus Aenigmatarchaeota archaeon]
MAMKCSTCGVNLLGQEGFVKLTCPSCGDEVIIRCRQCKQLSVPYKCGKCRFEGP